MEFFIIALAPVCATLRGYWPPSTYAPNTALALRIDYNMVGGTGPAKIGYELCSIYY